MSTERLLAAFSRIGDAPEHMEQLRKIVIALAVSGRLNDEAAVIEPVRPIETLGCDLKLQRKLSKQKKYPGVREVDLPKGFSNPSGFVRLGALARIERGQTGIKQVKPGSFPLVVTASERIACDHYDFDGAAAIVPLVSSTGHGRASLHRLHYQEGRFALGTILAAVFPHDPSAISARFLFEYLSAFKEELLVSRMIGTANVSLSIGKIAEVPVPIVCQEVQRKVDALMVLCDRLETVRTERETRRDRLVTASLNRLTVTDDGNSDDETRLAEHVRFHLQHLSRLSTRPEHIKKLRKVILDLAVSGQLIKQVRTDEPASSLLKSIAAEKAQLQKRITKVKQLPTIGYDKAIKLPAGWVWSRLGSLSELVTSGSRDWAKHYSQEGAMFIRMGNLSKGDYRLRLDHIQRVNPPSDGEGTRTRLEAGDLLISITGDVGMLGLIPEGFGEAYINQHTAMVRPVRAMKGRYLAELFRSSFAQDQFNAPQRGIKNSFRLTDVTQLVVPLPPLLEQHRIVAKVDELMALCDQLEASLAAAQFDRSRLLNALLHEALKPAAAMEDGRTHDRWLMRSAISSYVVSRLSSKRSFGRTAHMKHLYLAEAHLGLELDGAYAREAAGPLDVRIYDLEKQAASSGWYSPQVKVLASGYEKVTYSLGENIAQIVEEGVSILGSSRVELDRVLGLMGDVSTEEVEIIATLFAVWNDALIDAASPDDDWVVKEVRTHWHKSKQRFTPAELKKWLGWMRANDLVPAGKLPRTIQQTTLDF